MDAQKHSSFGADAPEVVPSHDPPEVVKNESHAKSYPEVRRSVDQPEALEVAAHEKQAYEYYHGNKQGSTWSADGGSNGAHSDEETIRSKYEQGQRKAQGRRFCGMRKCVFIAVIVIVTLVIVGAVLIGVLVAVLGGQSSSTTAIQAISGTGLASTVLDGTLYQYFQLPGGNVVENTYANNVWSLKSSSDAQDAVVTTEAASGSPMAAISYPFNGDNYRQIFYLNAAGMVRTTNRTATGSWSSPVSISQVAAEPGSIVLAACWNDQTLDGLRIYYASQYGYIQEIGGYFNGSQWNQYFGFSYSDSKSGVACSSPDCQFPRESIRVSLGDTADRAVFQVTNEPSNEYINVYFRNPKNSTVTQWYWNYDRNDGWYEGAVTGQNHLMASGSDIAVTSDAVQTEYVFYQDSENMIMLGINDPTQNYYESFAQRQTATPQSRLAAAYVDGGAMVVFQNSSSESTMWASDVSRDGVQIFNIAVS